MTEEDNEHKTTLTVWEEFKALLLDKELARFLKALFVKLHDYYSKEGGIYG